MSKYLENKQCDCKSEPKVEFSSCKDEMLNPDYLKHIMNNSDGYLKDPAHPQEQKTHLKVIAKSQKHGFRFIRIARERNLDVDYNIGEKGTMIINIDLGKLSINDTIRLAQEITKQVDDEIDGSDLAI